MAYNPQNLNGQAPMANSAPVVLASNQTPVPVFNSTATTTGSLTAAAQAITITLGGRYANTTFQVTGTYVGTLVFEASNDGFVNFTTINTIRAGENIVLQQISDSAMNDIYRATTAGLNAVRLRASAFTSGTATITILATEATSGVFLNFPIPAGTNSIGTTPGPTLTKGIQGLVGHATQDLKDSGRVNIAISCYQAPGILTTEALFAAATFAISRDGAAPITGQQYAVTLGKRLVIQTLSLSSKDTSTTASTSKVVLRYNGAGGVITNTSSTLGVWDIGDASLTAGAYLGPYVTSFPDGLELLAGSTIGFTNLASTVGILHTLTLNGFEY